MSQNQSSKYSLCPFFNSNFVLHSISVSHWPLSLNFSQIFSPNFVLNSSNKQATIELELNFGKRNKRSTEILTCASF